jgi:quercetin dioxygenase-like cupin family protein
MSSKSIDTVLHNIIKKARIASKDVSRYFSENRVVKYSDLISDDVFPPGKSILIGDGVKATKEIQGHRVRFHTEMPKGSHLGLHRHDCFEGTMILEGGEIVDIETGHVFTHSFYLQPGQSHNLVALEDSILMVDFYPA